MSKTVFAYAAMQKGLHLEPFTYDLPALDVDDVTIKVEYCGVCHSDLSMLNNDWGMSIYPLVAGHEIVGVIEELGEEAERKGLKIGQRVGMGWYAGSCLHCHSCRDGDQNLCATAEQTIVGRHGGFADRVRCKWDWAIPLPENLNSASAGPLFCGGLTVFNPIIQAGVKPTNKVGVIGIGGLGHMALQFLNKWGCEVTAFTSSPDKETEAKSLGAHNVVNSKDPTALKNISGSLDFIINTTNADLNWESYVAALAPRGHLHTVGVVPSPMAVSAFSLLDKQKSIGGSPLGSPATLIDMLEFCGRHNIAPQVEEFAISDINDALEHLHAGKARYRVVLKV